MAQIQNLASKFWSNLVAQISNLPTTDREAIFRFGASNWWRAWEANRRIPFCLVLRPSSAQTRQIMRAIVSIPDGQSARTPRLQISFPTFHRSTNPPIHFRLVLGASLDVGCWMLKLRSSSPPSLASPARSTNPLIHQCSVPPDSLKVSPEFFMSIGVAAFAGSS